uniref:Glycoside hydrolase 131 catalytic N-terminal domain-containing protein n=1 Tax=Globisporangium ultimum (strain ATCC 200006 / CBS 805.95 / DAOM BR144) TaxID=431595 RepID=K3WAF3_GLOUD
MKFTSVLLSAAAATCALFASGVAAQDKPLPWDGRGQDLTAATLDSKYMLHIFKQRQNAAKQDPALWVTVNQKGRSPAYNSDTGVISIAVDNDAIFGGQTNFRRSELVQNVAGNTAGKTFFRASVKKDEAWVNAHSWQVIFPESHLFEVRIDATTTPPKIIFYTDFIV